MTRPLDIAALLRDVVAAGTRHQVTLADQVGDDGLIVRCRDAKLLPAGVASPYLDSPDSPGAFLTVAPAGEKPARSSPDETGEVPPDVQEAFEREMRAWTQHRELYNDLFGARTPPEQFELVVAVGLVELLDGESNRHERHVVTAPAEIVLDQETQRLSVVVADAFRVEHNWLAGPLRSPLVEAADDRSNRPLLEVLADDAETYEGATTTWRRACSVYGQDTQWEPNDRLPVGVVGLSVDPAVLLRKKDTSHLLALLTAMADDLANGGHVTGPLRMLADLDAEVDDLATVTDRPALPKAANDEQRSMLEQARRSPHTIIQGPPGTGKTHTIANLAAVLLAEGRRVLITAENDRALREVQGKLPKDMQPLLLPLLKDKAQSGLARSVTSLIEEADKQRRGARPDLEGSLTARRDALESDAERTIREIRRVDALESQEHELNGQRMRLAGHMIALDGYRDDLSRADRYLTHQVAGPVDAQALCELHEVVTAADRELSKLRLPTGLPDSASFAEKLQNTREHLNQLPDRTEFDYASLDDSTVIALTNALPRLASLPAVPYASVDLSAGEYRKLASEARAARSGLNHGVTATGVDPSHARNYLAAYLDLPEYFEDEPTGLVELYSRTASATTEHAPSIHLAASAHPVKAHDLATKLSSRFATDPSAGLLSRYISDLRTRGDSNLKQLAEHAGQLAEKSGVPPTLPIDISDGAPADHELFEQAKTLRDYLASGGKMTRMIGTPGPVKEAAALIEHVIVGGSRVDTHEEAEAVVAWLQHCIAVKTARNWAAQHDLTPPQADADLKDWLTALSRLPGEAAELNGQLTALVQHCHVPAEAQTKPAHELVGEVLTSACAKIRSDLREFVAAWETLGGKDVRVDGVSVHDDDQAAVAHAHFVALVARNEIADRLPAPWTEGRDLHDVRGDDPLVIACEAAAAAADLPGVARPQTLTDATARDVLTRVSTDRRRQELTDEHSAFLGSIRAALSICAPASPATSLLEQAVLSENATSYREAHAAHATEVERAERATTLRNAAERLRKVHPTLVAAFLAGDDETHDVLTRLDHYQCLLEYRREAHALLDEYPDLRELHQHLAEVRKQHLRVESELASERCWSRAVERLADDRKLSAALSSLQKAERAVPKTKTAKTYQRKLRAMRAATREAAPAIPCWVMPIDKVAELIGYPTTSADRFDVVIVDEASQAWFPSAFLYAIAEQVVVVGDDLQTSPADTSVTHDEMVRLVRHHIPRHKLVDALDGQFSLYDIAAAITSPAVMADHFRCVPPIIELSNSLCYAQRGQRLLPVRVTEPEALTPIKHVRVAGRRKTAGSPNIPEVDAIVRKVVDCVADPDYDDLTFGVVIVGSRPQSHIKLLRSKLLEALGPKQMQKRQIEVGSPAQYQGAERHVMFLSLVDTPDENANVRKWPHELTGQNLRRIQSLNVAVSRARDQLWIFHSFGAENLKPGDVRHVVLSPAAMGDDATIEAQLAKCDSNFERDVVTALARHAAVAKVRTQVEALGYGIDIVIESYDKRRLAVECDGDAWHTSDEDVASDLYRQRTLEAAGGWRFQRFLASEWYADPSGVLQQTIDMLGAAPKPPAHPVDDAAAIDDEVDEVSDEDRADGLFDDDYPDVEDAEFSDADYVGQPKPSAESPDEPEGDAWSSSDSLTGGRETVRDVTPAEPDVAPYSSDVAHEAPEPQPEQLGGAHQTPTSNLHVPKVSAEGFAPYPSWNTAACSFSLHAASQQERNDVLMQIVETEGPLLGDRLYKLLVQTAGGARVGAKIRKELNSSTYSLERKRLVVTDNPLGESGQRVKTFRLPEQPEYVVRELGSRSLHEVPPAELAAVMASVRTEGQTDEEWFRAVLDTYGLVRLTAATTKRLEQCAELLAKGGS